jgi:hypothetical protein
MFGQLRARQFTMHDDPEPGLTVEIVGGVLRACTKTSLRPKRRPGKHWGVYGGNALATRRSHTQKAICAVLMHSKGTIASVKGTDWNRWDEHVGSSVSVARAIMRRSIRELQRELYVALALRAFDQAEFVIQRCAGRIQNGSVCNVEELHPELQALGFAQREFLLDT